MRDWLMGLGRLRNPIICCLQATVPGRLVMSLEGSPSLNSEGLRTRGVSGISPSSNLKTQEPDADVQGQVNMDVTAQAESKFALLPSLGSIQALSGLTEAHPKINEGDLLYSVYYSKASLFSKHPHRKSKIMYTNSLGIQLTCNITSS